MEGEKNFSLHLWLSDVQKYDICAKVWRRYPSQAQFGVAFAAEAVFIDQIFVIDESNKIHFHNCHHLGDFTENDVSYQRMR